MTNKDVQENWEKEAIRRRLLASTISSTYTGGLKGSPNRLASYWQKLLKKTWMH